MGKMSDREKQEIINRQKPGYVVRKTSKRHTEKSAAPPDSVTPDTAQLRRAARAKASTALDSGHSRPASDGTDVAELRRKFLSPDGESTHSRDRYERTEEAAGDDEIVPVRREDEADPYDGPSQQAKGVVISGKDRRIIGEQG